jgi:hypothetical protein
MFLFELTVWLPSKIKLFAGLPTPTSLHSWSSLVCASVADCSIWCLRSYAHAILMANAGLVDSTIQRRSRCDLPALPWTDVLAAAMWGSLHDKVVPRTSPGTPWPPHSCLGLMSFPKWLVHMGGPKTRYSNPWNLTMSAHLYHVPAGSITVGLTLPCGMMPAKPYLPPGCVQDGKIIHNNLPTL